MRFSIDVGSELELKLYQAVLLYKNDHGNRHMATVHGVVQQSGDGSPVLGAGQLLSTASLRELVRQLGTGCPVEFLPDHVVARTPDLLAWWTPAAVRPMFFRAGSELEGISGKRFPHPALLFVVRSNVLYVRALSASRRPSPDSKLAAAPYWNIGQRRRSLRRHHARAEVVDRDFDRRMAASLLPERIHPSGRRRTADEAPWRNGGALEKPGREEAVPADLRSSSWSRWINT